MKLIQDRVYQTVYTDTLLSGIIAEIPNPPSPQEENKHDGLRKAQADNLANLLN